MFRVPGAVECHHDDGCIIDVRVIIIGVLERPAAGPDVRATKRPVANNIEDLARHQPVGGSGYGLLHPRLLGRVTRQTVRNFKHRLFGKARIPDRRHARLDIRIAVIILDHQPTQRFLRDHQIRIVLGIAERYHRHDRIGHGGKDTAEAIHTVEALKREVHRLLDRQGAQALREIGLGLAQHDIDQAKRGAPEIRHRGVHVALFLIRRGHEKLFDRDAPGIDRARFQRHQHDKRGDHGPRPIGDLGDMEREPFRQDHDLDRHHRHAAPGNEAEQCQRRAGEHVGAGGTTGAEDHAARAPHMRCVDIIPGQFQREIRLDRRAQVEGTVVEQRPAAVLALDLAQIRHDLGLQLLVDLVEVMHQHDVFGGDRRIGLKGKDPVTILLLPLDQGL